ncbi:hypothetical protein IMG5_175560 [Ichthyophthirius multifiliis]|uniref:Peptidase A1 domain-containing protein n=1 Tax=Ichthyophthirius multifiliis TaxID=5932 RepID=G0R272_ICHMU|nr:hypothetical protein IMG5_175560 [Ichthyophthirius multifiliis]EGR28439.1 hypothetical protein IMG5_175560 [Ichthyophthirius multifiliis]|eukprot:XP_004029675.1 hypothetical protein IMG5_175560 [Ichthyophthirius multifiliis]
MQIQILIYQQILQNTTKIHIMLEIYTQEKILTNYLEQQWIQVLKIYGCMVNNVIIVQKNRKENVTYILIINKIPVNQQINSIFMKQIMDQETSRGLQPWIIYLYQILIVNKQSSKVINLFWQKKLRIQQIYKLMEYLGQLYLLKNKISLLQDFQGLRNQLNQINFLSIFQNIKMIVFYLQEAMTRTIQRMGKKSFFLSRRKLKVMDYQFRRFWIYSTFFFQEIFIQTDEKQIQEINQIQTNENEEEEEEEQYISQYEKQQKKALIDTGTTNIVMGQRDIYALILIMKQEYGINCQSIQQNENFQNIICDCNDIQKYPDLYFSMKDINNKLHILTLQPEDYIQKEKNYVRLQIIEMSEMEDTIILGTVFLKKYMSIYDEGKFQIGLVKAKQIKQFKFNFNRSLGIFGVVLVIFIFYIFNLDVQKEKIFK